MENQTFNLSSYNLNFIKTDKFKTITILVNFKRPAKKEEVTLRSMLSLMLIQSTKNYSTKRLLAIQTEKLYGIEINVNIKRIGKQNAMSFELKMLDEKYTETKMIEQSLKFLFEMLLNPNASNGKFDTKSFNIIKSIFESNLKSIKDNTGQYSVIRMLEEMDINSPISYRMGYLDDLKAIDEKVLYDYYKSVIKSDLLDIYVLGNVDVREIKNIFKEHFTINTIKKGTKGVLIEHKEYRHRIRIVKEQEHIKQAKLTIGCKLMKLTDYERRYVLPLYSNILGGSSYSRLFNSVREKHSLAYSIWSHYQAADNLLIITAGINNDTFDKTLKLIKKEISNMEKSKITEQELNSAKSYMISIIKDIKDNSDLIVNSYILMDLLHLDALDLREQNYLNVSIDDIKKVAQKVKMDTVYLLYGDDQDEKNID